MNWKQEVISLLIISVLVFAGFSAAYVYQKINKQGCQCECNCCQDDQEFDRFKQRLNILKPLEHFEP
jgi:hypothetical protein